MIASQSTTFGRRLEQPWSQYRRCAARFHRQPAWAATTSHRHHAQEAVFSQPIYAALPASVGQGRGNLGSTGPHLDLRGRRLEVSVVTIADR